MALYRGGQASELKMTKKKSSKWSEQDSSWGWLVRVQHADHSATLPPPNNPAVVHVRFLEKPNLLCRNHIICLLLILFHFYRIINILLLFRLLIFPIIMILSLHCSLTSPFLNANNLKLIFIIFVCYFVQIKHYIVIL